MTNGNRATIHIHPLGVNVQSLIHRTSLCRKRFVELKQIHLRGLPTGTLQRFARSWHRAHAHGGGVQARGGKRGDATQRRQAQRLRFGGGHDHDGGRAVVEARGIARRHRTRFVKRRTQASQGFGVGFQVDELIGGEHHSIAFFLGQQHRGDFVFELASRLRSGGFLLAGQRQRVLHIAADVVLLGHVFSGDAHVVLVVHIPQTVDDHAVNQLPVTHALAVPRVGQQMGCSAHIFLATRDDDVAVAPSHRLSSQHHGFEA